MSATITPLPLGGITNVDLFYLLAVSLLLFFAGRYYKVRTITRVEGVFMIFAYVVCTGYLIYMLKLHSVIFKNEREAVLYKLLSGGF